ncbi:MAG: cytoplasmic protein [Verrucomicrobiae bacterium]|nr:cytoplasmic protein [Verrucomicrobiae bacterium]
MDQFDSFTASQLYCPKCQKPMPVREKLLLVLPDKEIYDYLCIGCATSLGQREVSLSEQPLRSLVRKSRLKKKNS